MSSDATEATHKFRRNPFLKKKKKAAKTVHLDWSDRESSLLSSLKNLLVYGSLASSINWFQFKKKSIKFPWQKVIIQFYCIVRRKKEIWTEKNGSVLHGIKTNWKDLAFWAFFLFVLLNWKVLSAVMWKWSQLRKVWLQPAAWYISETLSITWTISSPEWKEINVRLKLASELWSSEKVLTGLSSMLIRTTHTML